MNEETRLQQAIQRWLGCQYVRCRTTQGMWIIEVVLGGVDAARKKVFWEEVGRHLTATLGAGQVIWKAYIYSTHEERYTGQGTLHSQPSAWENGMLTTILSATDCYTDITEFDNELLQMGAPQRHVVYARESVDENGTPILPYQNGATHTWIEVMGGSYSLAPNGVNLTQGRNHPYSLEITLE